MSNTVTVDLPGGPGAKNLPVNTGDVGSIPCPGIKISHDVEQLTSPRAAMSPSAAAAAVQAHRACAVHVARKASQGGA